MSADARSQHIPRTLGSDESQSYPGVTAPHLVDEETDRTLIVRDDDIRVAVVVDIAESRAAAHV